jgi:hypothetical protein
MEIAGLIALAFIFGAALTAVALAFRTALADRDHRRVAEVEKAEIAADLRITEAALETTDRIRLAEKARADALEEELHAADTAAVLDPDPGARRRVLSRWREANAATAGSYRGEPAKVPDPAPAEPAGRVGRSD